MSIETNQNDIEALLDRRIKRLLDTPDEEWAKIDIDEFEKLNKILSVAADRRKGVKPLDWTDGASMDDLNEVLPD